MRPRSDHQNVGGELLGTAMHRQLETFGQQRLQQRRHLVPRVSHAVVALGGKLYVFGGVTMDGALRNLDDAYVYAPADRKWTTLPKLPAPRRAFWATAVRGRILLFGGYTADYSGDVFEFDPKTQSTVQIGPLPHALADGKFILLGWRILTAGGEASDKIRVIWTLEGNFL